MKILSEDNRYMTTSILMAKYFNIEYIGGNSGLRKYTKNKDSKNLVILVDVVPDNPFTIGLYRAMVSDIDRNKLKEKVYLYPIVCTEYFVLQSLWELGIELKYKFPWMIEVERAVKQKRTIQEYVPRGQYDYSESFVSFEKQCKLLLNNSDLKFHNVNISKDRIKEIYGNISYYLWDDTLSTYDKAISIAKKYPAIVMQAENTSSNDLICKLNLAESCREYQNQFCQWIESDISLSLGSEWWKSYE